MHGLCDRAAQLWTEPFTCSPTTSAGQSLGAQAKGRLPSHLRYPARSQEDAVHSQTRCAEGPSGRPALLRYGCPLLQVGTCTAELQGLLRQGREFCSQLLELPVVKPAVVRPQCLCSNLNTPAANEAWVAVNLHDLHLTGVHAAWMPPEGACDHGAGCKAETPACHLQGAEGGAALAGSLLLRIINVGYLPLVQQAPSPHRAVDRQLQLQGQQGTPGRVRRVRVRPGGQGAGGLLLSSLRCAALAACTSSSAPSCRPGLEASRISLGCCLLAHGCSRATRQPDWVSSVAICDLPALQRLQRGTSPTQRGTPLSCTALGHPPRWGKGTAPPTG